MSRHLNLALLSAATCLLLASCGGGGSSSVAGPAPAEGDSGMEIYLTDAPLDGVEQVRVTIDSIQLHMTGGPFFEVLQGPKTVDLLKLKDRMLLVGKLELPAGKYTEVRLVVSDGEITVDGETFPLKIPSGTVKTKGPFDLPEGTLAVLVLDFDAEESLHITQTGNDKYILRPVIKKLSYEFKTEEDCPDVESSDPADGDVDVLMDTTISATFPAGTPMPGDPESLLLVADTDGTLVEGTTEVSGTTVTFTPDDALQPETTYDVTVQRKELPDLKFCPPEAFSFTTAACVEYESADPADEETGVPVDTTISVTFPAGTEMPGDPSTLLRLVDPDDNIVPGSSEITGTTVTFTPDDDLLADSDYKVRVRRRMLPGYGSCTNQRIDFTTAP